MGARICWKISWPYWLSVSRFAVLVCMVAFRELICFCCCEVGFGIGVSLASFWFDVVICELK